MAFNMLIAFLEHKQTDSACWADLLKIKDLHVSNGMIVGAGEQTSFWDGAWCTYQFLMAKFPELYEICNEQHVPWPFAGSRRWQFTFRRWLVRLDENQQNQLARMRDILLTNPLVEWTD